MHYFSRYLLPINYLPLSVLNLMILLNEIKTLLLFSDSILSSCVHAVFSAVSIG